MIIGFGHRSGVGKDTAAKLLKTDLRRNGESVEIISFASVLKKNCHQMCGWAGLEDELFYNNNREARLTPLPKLGGKTPVDIWVEVGEAMRAIHEDTWVEALFAQAAADHLLIPDVRHQNEVEIIKRYGGMVIRIDRDVPALPGKSIDDLLGDYDEWDAVVKNDGDLRNLNDKLLELI